jgi:hypothetical protein
MTKKKSSNTPLYLYIITNISMPDICKVGITNNIDRRLKDLNKTSLPTRFQIYETFKLENAEILEQTILQHFAENRINKKREFLKIHPERICDFIQENKNIKIKKDENVMSKFGKMKINKGEVLKFKEGEKIYQNIIAKVGEGNNIIYQGNKTSLSKSAQKILKEKFDKHWKAVQGTIYWTYKGKTIREIMDENNL